MVHSPAYLMRLEEACLCDKPYFMSEDCVVHYESFGAIMAAAGTALALGRALADGDSGFALTRPPGHHAGRETAEGFCFLNHAALATAAFRLSFPEARVLIVDFDVHHGNGISDLFYRDPATFYYSIHGSPAHIYPWRGFSNECGDGRAAGTTLNVTLPIGCDGATWLSSFAENLQLAVATHRPEATFVCAGFDAHRDDPFGLMNVEDEHFLAAVKLLDELAGERLGLLLEGGYHPVILAKLVPAIIRRLAASRNPPGPAAHSARS
jgi:acetoin utilization deacetylase AcuC-like enzyme